MDRADGGLRFAALGKPETMLADSGYFSKEAVAGLEALGLDPYMATGRQRHHAPAEAVPPQITRIDRALDDRCIARTACP